MSELDNLSTKFRFKVPSPTTSKYQYTVRNSINLYVI